MSLFLSPPQLRPPGATVRLDAHTRLTLARRAQEYISSLVADRHGDQDDVRSVIRRLHAEVALAGRPGRP